MINENGNKLISADDNGSINMYSINSDNLTLEYSKQKHKNVNKNNKKRYAVH
jgi:hypothetical protein